MFEWLGLFKEIFFKINMNKKINAILEQLAQTINNYSKNYIDSIVQECARVENYFAVQILGELKKMEAENKINGLVFQKHLPGENRKHIDFYFEIEGRKVYMEVKHFAIDTEKKKNRRTIEFYTGNTESQKKVGLLGDFDKLSSLKSEKSTEVIVFAVVTKPPPDKEINKVIKRLNEATDYSSWDIKSVTSTSNLMFLIANKTI